MHKQLQRKRTEARENVSCLRPDGKWCEHKESDHLTNTHPIAGAPFVQGCTRCWLEDGSPILGPSAHRYNPHLWTEAGWLPVDAAEPEPSRSEEERQVTKPLDPDIKALRGAVRAIKGSTPRMLRANMEYLWDRFIEHPADSRSKEE